MITAEFGKLIEESVAVEKNQEGQCKLSHQEPGARHGSKRLYGTLEQHQ